ncbi:protein kinase domain-containing protein [Tahibacter soli]|uniref:Protein kinase n=1 Tax=Tahibacter soli TaxID=2983605 RepID=A0A9X4BKQ0_9GAMM|nr:protein kinase [Tahibacter soli]MDC8015943.1 protein kinase [Tahibacter soli]
MIDLAEFPADISRALLALAEHYEYLSSNDRGANGYVIFGRNRVSRADVAIKFYFGQPGAHQHDEPRLLSAVRSANILQILEARQVSTDWAYFITPLCAEGDVDDFISTSPSLHRSIDVALGICAGVSALHALRIVHRDLKPANIVLAAGIPQIADFGSVRLLDAESNEVDASAHSVIYRPPESFVTGRYSIRGDVYQIGLVTYQLLGGRLSYDGFSYFNVRDRRNYVKLVSDFDRSRFVDSVIRRHAIAQQLMDLSSLPDWIDNQTRRALRRMTSSVPGDRLGSTADVAAELTAMRARLRDWRWNGGVATLQMGAVRIELRPSRTGTFEAFRDYGSGFRRVPNLAPGTIGHLVRALA